MAIDYMDSWELNGDTVLIRDFGKGKNGGVGVLDENGKIPSSAVPIIYTSDLITSKKDKRNMTLKEWTDRAVPFFNNYGTVWNNDDSEYVVTNYYAELDIKFAIDSNNQRFISIKGSPYQLFTLNEISYCVGNVLGARSNYFYMDDVTLRNHNYTYITAPSSMYELGVFVFNNTLFLVGRKDMGNSVYYISLMTSTDGINFTEQYEHELTYPGSMTYSHNLHAAYNNGTYVFRDTYFTLTLKNNTFYYNDEIEPNLYPYIYFFKGVFTDLHQWSEDGLTWEDVSYPDGEPTAPVLSIGVLFNKIVFEDNRNDYKFWYTEEGKVVHSYSFELYAGTSRLYRMNFIPTFSSDNGVLFCYGSTGSSADNRHVIYVTKDAEHFTELFAISENYSYYTVYIAYDKGKAYLSDKSTNGIILHKQTPYPDLWLPYSTHGNYIKGGN